MFLRNRGVSAAPTGDIRTHDIQNLLRVLTPSIFAPETTLYIIVARFGSALACSYCEVPEYAQIPNDEGYMEIITHFPIPTEKHIVKTNRCAGGYPTTSMYSHSLLTGF
jgi:hypothetical protein